MRPGSISEWVWATGLATWLQTAATLGAENPTASAWSEAMSSVGAKAADSESAAAALERDFPRQCDWWLQDSGAGVGSWLGQDAGDLENRAMGNVLAELGTEGADLRQELVRLRQTGITAGDRRSLELYERACSRRRQLRLKALETSRRIVFTKHCNLGGSHYAYTEGQSDAQSERTFIPGAALCLLEVTDGEPQVRTLLESRDGVIRDPDVSWDGKRVLFAWKKSDREDDFHLYEMEVSTGKIRQITSGLGFADYEGVYLPDGDLLFTSTRCVQTVDCWWTEVSNLYTCGPGGEFLRRLTFDQVHDNYPTVMPDGRIIYTRWEYSDRGQLFVQGLFQMNPDGTGQTEFYGNNSWFPTSLLHARGIPGTEKVVAIFSGHHTLQAGKLGVVDVARGRQENSGAHLIAPSRATPAEHTDAYGQDGELFQYPYPLSDTAFLVAYASRGWAKQPTLFQLYLVMADGRREFLAADAVHSCNQPVPLRPRVRPVVRPSLVDYRQTDGVVYLQDIYAGPGLAEIRRGSVRSLRVVALEYRAAGVGRNYNRGPAGEALVSTPVSIGNGAWDLKTVLGEATVHPDGSACFQLPARVPVYFQAIDENGYAIQSMRSWTTLQPGERLSCVGCHESKNRTPIAEPVFSQTFRAGPEPLRAFHGAPRAFSFRREVQPILDRHCIRCHDNSDALRQRLEMASDQGGPGVITGSAPSSLPSSKNSDHAFSLRGVTVVEEVAKRAWSESYLALTQAHWWNQENTRSLEGRSGDLVNWIGAQSVPDLLPPYGAGAARSQLLSMLRGGHHEVGLSRAELEIIACWIDLLVPFCGDYAEAEAWSAEDKEFYTRFLRKRQAMVDLEQGHIEALVRSQSALASGHNVGLQSGQD